ncbi:heterokaryon incompatibility protein-domain-containing protein [Coniochaeta sp. 2T2.1]|nr:heterokaryon incompatibility protein-domain-containing protein [Coniochaeta sp. 2T2.1]
MPTRLLEIDPQANSRHIRLVSDTGILLKERYAALSHCWGKSPTNTTTKAVFVSHTQGIDILSLSKTFQHTIFVTRELGIRYLWIDSLCIIQDDEDDWKREAENMADVFANAFVTIAASASTDGDGGLFYPRALETERSGTVRWTI